MFSSIFGKRRSPVEDDTPPIPGPKPEDGFVVVDPSLPGRGLYPNVGGGGSLPAMPQRPAPPTPRAGRVDQTFHYLQGVPFTLCRELKMASNKDALTAEVTDHLAFLTRKFNVNTYDYEFKLEKSVLQEVSS
nr:uncharacterized protein LOC128675082 [Plodia interpunctella]